MDYLKALENIKDSGYFVSIISYRKEPWRISIATHDIHGREIVRVSGSSVETVAKNAVEAFHKSQEGKAIE